MARRADPGPERVLRANPVLARGCEVCRGWGTVVTDEGWIELCPACQTDVGRAEPGANGADARRIPGSGA